MGDCDHSGVVTTSSVMLKTVISSVVILEVSLESPSQHPLHHGMKNWLSVGGKEASIYVHTCKCFDNLKPQCFLMILDIRCGFFFTNNSSKVIICLISNWDLEIPPPPLQMFSSNSAWGQKTPPKLVKSCAYCKLFLKCWVHNRGQIITAASLSRFVDDRCTSWTPKNW